MTQPILSHKKSQALSFALFLAGLAIIAFFDYWWPGIMLVIGVPLALRQFLFRKYYDMAISLVVFFGVYVSVAFHFKWKLLLPVLFIIGAIYVIFREFIASKVESEDEIEEDLNEEIEEDQHKKK